MSRKLEHPSPYDVITTLTYGPRTPLATGPARRPRRKSAEGGPRAAMAEKSRPTNASVISKDA
jgi:hypothetical protein